MLQLLKDGDVVAESATNNQAIPASVSLVYRESVAGEDCQYSLKAVGQPATGILTVPENNLQFGLKMYGPGYEVH